MTFGSREILLVVNPVAGRRRRGLVAAVVGRVRAAGWSVDIVETRGPGDARRLAETCDATRYGVIAAAGGDGTVNEVINGLAGRSAAGPALALVPLGTANVLAHEVGLPATAEAIAGAMTGGRLLVVRPGIATDGDARGRCFALMAGAGFDAAVVAGVGPALKRRWGRAAYLWRSLVEIWRYRPVRYGVEVDGVLHAAASVVVTRSRHYAGPYLVAEAASLAAPLLQVCLFERWGRVAALRFGGLLLLGRLPGAAGYRVVAGRTVRLTVLDAAGRRGRQPVQIDGDDALSLPVSIGLCEAGIRLLVPAAWP